VLHNATGWPCAGKTMPGVRSGRFEMSSPMTITMKPPSPESIRVLKQASGKRTWVWRRCRCGQCRRCLDNVRWERIFAEKFADPDYYTRSGVRCLSPLTSL
jgi:hypothetical protein